MTAQDSDEKPRDATADADGSIEAASAGAPGTAEAPAPQDGSQAPAAKRRKPRRLAGTTLFALALGLFAAAAAASLWWQSRQFYAALDAADGANAESLTELRTTLGTLADELGELGAQREDMAGVIESMAVRIDALPARFSNLEERIADVQGVSTQTRQRWLRAQADYFLSVARTELTLRRNRAGAIAALELADGSLRESGNPAFAGVRESIAGELLALRGVREPDVDGLSYSLNRLGSMVAELPMRGPAGGGADAALDEAAEPGLGRLWLSLKRAFAGMVRIERQEADTGYSLTQSEQLLVRRRVELELALGRLGLARALPELFSASLSAAKSLLEQHFETSDARVDGAVTLLEEMLRLDVAPEYPDIGGPLTLLRNLPDRNG